MEKSLPPGEVTCSKPHRSVPSPCPSPASCPIPVRERPDCEVSPQHQQCESRRKDRDAREGHVVAEAESRVMCPRAEGHRKLQVSHQEPDEAGRVQLGPLAGTQPCRRLDFGLVVSGTVVFSPPVYGHLLWFQDTDTWSATGRQQAGHSLQAQHPQGSRTPVSRGGQRALGSGGCTSGLTKGVGGRSGKAAWEHMESGLARREPGWGAR